MISADQAPAISGKTKSTPQSKQVRRAKPVEFFLLCVAVLVGSAKTQATPHFPTAADSIIFEDVYAPLGAAAGSPFVCTEDRTRCAMISFHGVLATDSNIYRLHVFSMRRSVAQMERWSIIGDTKSNLPAISELQWTARGLCFLKRNISGRGRVHCLDMATGAMVLEGDAGIDVAAYSASADGKAYLIAPAPKSIELFPSPVDRSRGRSAEGLTLAELMNGQVGNDGFLAPIDRVIFLRGNRRLEVPLPEPLALQRATLGGISVSPDGRWAVAVETRGQERWCPGTWQSYHIPVGWVLLPRLRLIDLKTGASRPLLDAPAIGAALTTTGAFAWTGDGSALLTSTLLPLGHGSEHVTSPNGPYLVRYDLATGRVTLVSEGLYSLTRVTDGRLHATKIDGGSFNWAADKDTPTDIWLDSSGVRTGTPIAPTTLDDCDLMLVQDVNTPPRVEYRCKDGARSTVLDLDPQIRTLTLARVTEIEFADTDGKLRHVGLFTPAGAKPGERRPLVIQTHGWGSGLFSLNGSLGSFASNAGFAAQALAGQGFYVVQGDFSGPSASASTYANEAANDARNIDALIDVLVERDLVDPTRLGILGWSRTGMSLRASLARSKYSFRAAVSADAETKNYSEYLALQNFAFGQQDLERMNGSPPIGSEGLRSYAAAVDEYHLKPPLAALKLYAFGPMSLAAGTWETYVLWRHLGGDVSLLYLPDAAHNPVRPIERMTVQQGAVDWFSRYLSSGR